MFAPLQGSPVPHDTLVITWTGVAEITWYGGNLIGLMRRRHIYKLLYIILYIWRRLINLPVGGVDSAAHHVIIAILGI